MKLTLGFSPCPNDTFIFDAMVNGRIDTGGLEFDYFVADVEDLNRRAFKSEADITKISCHAFAFAADNYLILDSGSAMGYGNGPLLISKRFIDQTELNHLRIAVPGKFTTANMLFNIAWPNAANRIEYLFSEIENALLNDEADAGLIIHETRFTYQKKGLLKIADLGEYWEKLTGLPVPLGVIAVNRRIPLETAMKVNSIIQKSIIYAKKHPEASYDFISSLAQEMDNTVISSHIKLFVNEFSVQLGEDGKKALSELYRISYKKGITPLLPERIFLT